jgi:hypothetical protein
MTATPPLFLRIAHFIAGNRIVDSTSGAPTTAFLRQLNDMIANISSAVNSLKSTQDDLIATIEAAGIALTTAEAAHDLAIAQGKSASLIASYVDPTAVLSAEVDPADSTKAKITIADHTRKYGDGTSVSVTGGSLSGLDQDHDYYITYMDTAFAGGTVTYVAQYSALTAGQDNPTGQHTVGDIITPATSSAPPTTGGGPRPPGTTCVVLETLVRMANETNDGPGVEKRAGDIMVGDFVWTQHEHTMEWGAYPVTAIKHLEQEIMSAPGFPDATGQHPFWIDDQWVLMEQIGEPEGEAMIVHMKVADAHTFMARHPDSDLAILSHNKSVDTFFDG